MTHRDELIDNLSKTNLVGGLYDLRKQELEDLSNAIKKYEHDKKNCDYHYFTFRQKKIKMNDEQYKVITEDLNKNIVILACAGSGKTTTIVCRVKYLIDHDILPERIMLTTFNVDACESIKMKINEVFGFTPCINIGTIDSIACKFYYRYFRNSYHLGVCEYTTALLQYLNTDDGKMILRKYQYLFFDEFQDINDIQFQIIKCFYEAGTRVVFIGDDAQNIYQWRGSDIKYILNIKTYIPNISVHKLTLNYRSTPEIIHFANNSIIHNTDQIPKEMRNFHPSINFKPLIQHFDSLQKQSEEVVKFIVGSISTGFKQEDIAVISRNNYPLKNLEEAIEKYNRNTTPKIKYISLITDNNNDFKAKIRPDHLTLTTIHKAKGLEWECVILISCDDEKFPSALDSVSLQEERRLFYVAVTRAKRYLLITFTKSTISRFVAEINDVLYRFTNFYSGYFNFGSWRIIHYDNSVVKLIEMLQESDIKEMRDKHLIPKINPIVKKIHEPTEHNPYIDKYFLQADFGEFIDRYITRLICEKQKSTCIQDRCASQVIASITVTRSEFIIYKEYVNNFTLNFRSITVDDTQSEVIQKLSKHSNSLKIVHIQPQHYGFIFNLVKKMLDVDSKFHLNGSVMVIPKKYIPEEFIKEMSLAYIKYLDHKQPTDNILKEIYEISLCGNICNERRRLLYKNVYNEFTEKYQKMFQHIKTKYVDKLDLQDIVCKKYLRDKEFDIIGELDMMNKHKIVDFKCSVDQSCKLEWLIQLLTYASIYKKNISKNNIKYVEVYNPLCGNIYTYDISEWHYEKELLQFLNHMREKRMSRNTVTIHNTNKDYQIYSTLDCINTDKSNILQQKKQILLAYIQHLKDLTYILNYIDQYNNILKRLATLYKKITHKMETIQGCEDKVPKYIVFDTETTGLPHVHDGEYPSYKNLSKYDCARLVQLSWCVCDQHKHIITVNDHIILPDKFVIHNDYIHGITQDHAIENGKPIKEVLTLFFQDLLKVNTIIGHNVEFDIHIIKSESFRYNFENVIDKLDKMKVLCTMNSAKKIFNRMISQKELYKYFFNEEMSNMHNSKYDTLNLVRIVSKLCQLGFLTV